MEEFFLKPARAAGVREAELVRRAARFVRIAGECAPHWLEEAAAAASAAGVDGEVYVAFLAGVYRSLFLGSECTSYAFAPSRAGGAVLFHKNRDNADRDQAAFVLSQAAPGLNRFIAVSDASVLACMMMVNERGLAGSADMGGPPVKEPRYRGMMKTFLLRHVAERAADCREALAIVREFVERGWYAGGRHGRMGGRAKRRDAGGHGGGARGAVKNGAVTARTGKETRRWDGACGTS